jgi:hypothetical protein
MYCEYEKRLTQANPMTAGFRDLLSGRHATGGPPPYDPTNPYHAHIEQKHRLAKI